MIVSGEVMDVIPGTVMYSEFPSHPWVSGAVAAIWFTLRGSLDNKARVERWDSEGMGTTMLWFKGGAIFTMNDPGKCTFDRSQESGNIGVCLEAKTK